MTKTELIGRMARQANISRDQAKAALDAFTDGVAEALAQGIRAEVARLQGLVPGLEAGLDGQSQQRA